MHELPNLPTYQNLALRPLHFICHSQSIADRDYSYYRDTGLSSG
jgi:hypothetical protein